MASDNRRPLPWGKILRWCGLYLLVSIIGSVVLYATGIVPDSASQTLGKAIGFGLVAVCAAAIAADRKQS